MAEYGAERMRQDVSRLRQMVSELRSDCVLGLKYDGAESKTGLHAVYTFETDPDKPWCAPYTRREVQYCEMIRRHQTERVKELRLKGKIV